MATEMNNNGRSLAGVVNEIKQEIKDFLQTRYDMLRAELDGKLKIWKIALPMLAVAAVLLLLAFLLLNLCVVAAIAVSFATPYGWCYAFLIVGFFWLIVGGVVAAFGAREIQSAPLTPDRTIRVLKQDQAWIATEARSQL